MENTRKCIKGFDNELKCRDFQYEVGKEYKLKYGEEAKICEKGFHAIDGDECPLSVFNYYPPCDENGTPNRYCEVEIGGKTEKREEKIVGSEIKIGAEIGIPGIVKAHIEWVKRHLIDDDEHKSSNTGNYSSASNTGNYSSASNTGDQSSASNTGYRSSASNTGDHSSAEVSGKDSVAIATGYDSKARGALGCAIVVAERGDWNGETYPLIGINAAIVDGVKIKADTWYTVRNGEFVEVKDNN